MKNRICAIVLTAALAAMGGTASAQCNPEVRDCPGPQPDTTTKPVEISLAPEVRWIESGKLSDAPKRAGYGRLSFQLVNPNTEQPLNVDLTPGDREFADRTFLGWLGNFFSDTEQTYMLSVEVVDVVDGEVKVIHRRPVYAYTSRESFSSISDNQMIDFGGDIGFFFKSIAAQVGLLIVCMVCCVGRVVLHLFEIWAVSHLITLLTFGLVGLWCLCIVYWQACYILQMDETKLEQLRLLRHLAHRFPPKRGNRYGRRLARLCDHKAV